jgi:hypothetical protein
MREAIRVLMGSPIYFRMNLRQRLECVHQYMEADDFLTGSGRSF